MLNLANMHVIKFFKVHIKHIKRRCILVKILPQAVKLMYIMPKSMRKKLVIYLSKCFILSICCLSVIYIKK